MIEMSNGEYAQHLMLGPFTVDGTPFHPNRIEVWGQSLINIRGGLSAPICMWAHGLCLYEADWMVYGPCHTDHGKVTLFCAWHIIEHKLRIQAAVESSGGTQLPYCDFCGTTGLSFRYCRVESHERFQQWWKDNT